MEFRDLVTVAEVRSATGWAVDDYSDSQIQTMITDVSIFIESLIGHAFPYFADRSITFIGTGCDRIEFVGFSPPLAGAPSFVNDAAFDSDYYDLHPVDAPHYEVTSRSGHFADGERIEIVANWGWENIPSDVKACAIRLIRRYADDSGWAGGLSGSSSSALDIKKVDIGEGKASVTFGDSSASSAGIRSTGDAVCDRMIRRYRRRRIGAVA